MSTLIVLILIAAVVAFFMLRSGENLRFEASADPGGSRGSQLPPASNGKLVGAIREVWGRSCDHKESWAFSWRRRCARPLWRRSPCRHRERSRFKSTWSSGP
jgi:hypothetical protein